MRAPGGDLLPVLLKTDSDAAPEETNDARLSEEERDAIPDHREHSHEARRSRLGARWVALDAEHCPARAVTGEDIDPEEYVVENS